MASAFQSGAPHSKASELGCPCGRPIFDPCQVDAFLPLAGLFLMECAHAGRPTSSTVTGPSLQRSTCLCRLARSIDSTRALRRCFRATCRRQTHRSARDPRQSPELSDEPMSQSLQGKLKSLAKCDVSVSPLQKNGKC